MPQMTSKQQAEQADIVLTGSRTTEPGSAIVWIPFP